MKGEALKVCQEDSPYWRLSHSTHDHVVEIMMLVRMGTRKLVKMVMMIMPTVRVMLMRRDMVQQTPSLLSYWTVTFNP